ncbi:MAG: acyltransferase [Cyclobacteriaceae bacterium]
MTDKNQRQFFPEIETLRAIAVIMVMLAHFIPKTSAFHIPYMFYGVDLFFTISGFLITYILLGQIEANQHSSGGLIKNFFVRRVLRLFPVYYAFIGFFFILRNVFSVYIWTNDYNLYFFSYLQNMYYFYQGALNTSFSHLWSLGVEEQFYLVWPFLVIFIPKRHLVKVFVLFIVSSILLNVIYQPTVDAFRVLTVANLHTLGGGALLAFLLRYRDQSKVYQFLVNNRLMLLVLSLAVFVITLNYQGAIKEVQILLIELFLAFTTFMAVLISIHGWPSVFGSLFRSRHVQHIGKVSYGIYLFHMLIPVVLSIIIEKVPIMKFLLPEQIMLRVFLLIVYSYVLAIISYNAYEIHFLKLKARFN